MEKEDPLNQVQGRDNKKVVGAVTSAAEQMFQTGY